MPTEYYIDSERGLVCSVFKGNVQDDEFIALYEKVYSDSAWSIEQDEIADIRNGNISQLSSGALRTVSQIAQSHFEGRKSTPKTAVVGSIDTIPAIVNLYNVQNPDNTEVVRAFTDKDEALKWLGQDEGAID